MEVKQVIIIRKDLKMRRGKEIAQGAHASGLFLRERFLEMKRHELDSVWGMPNPTAYLTEAQWAWLEGYYAKITVCVNSEIELLELERAAKQAGIEAHVVTDLGLTEFGGVPTKTCLAIGPDEGEKINKITGHLKLY